MKFLLVFMMCHQASSTCLPRMDTGVLYNTFRDCALAGYEQAGKIIADIPPIQMEKNQTIIKFWCQGKKILEEKKDV